MDRSIDHCSQRRGGSPDERLSGLFAAAGVSSEDLQGRKLGVLSEVGDEISVRVGGQGEGLGSAGVQTADQFGVDVFWFLAGQGEGAVVAGKLAVESIDLSLREDDPVLGSPSWQHEVSGFAVQAIGADCDRQVPRAALRSMGGECVGVVDCSCVEVVG